MRILILSRDQNRVERGAENFIRELTKYLSNNHKVDIFSGKDADSLGKIIKGRYDVVVPVNGRLQSLKVSLGRIIGKYKILISGHSGIGRDDIWNIVVAKPDIFVALTDYMANWAKKWAWGSKVVKIPNGIDLTRFSPEGEKIKIDLPKPVILSVGALVWYKHHERVIRAVSGIKKGSVLIVGKGPDGEKLRQIGEELLGDRFKIASFDYEDMPKVYRSVDLFTLPSWDREAFGIVYLEAMASGLGVVAPDDCSRREIAGEAGMYVNVDDVSLYSEVLKKALELDWREKARIQAKKFSWDKITKDYERIFEKLV